MDSEATATETASTGWMVATVVVRMDFVVMAAATRTVRMD